MDRKRTGFGFRAGLVILLFLPLFSLGAIESEWKDQIVESQRFTLKYITTFQGGTPVEITDPVWPDGISKISGPYTAQRTIQKDDDTFATVLQVIYTLRGDEAGIFSIPSVSVSSGSEVQTSEPITVPILRKDESFLYYPLILKWMSLPETIYAGQAVPLVLVLENLEEISLPDSVDLQTPASSILENITGLGDIHYSSMGDKTLYHVPMDTWMLTPSKAGNLRLGPGKVKILGLTRQTQSHTIQVLPLPDGVSRTGAVGHFEYTLKVPSYKGVAGEPLSLFIRVEGSGNLNYLVLPEPVFPDDLSVVKKEVTGYSASMDGYSGFREVQYTLTPDSQGTLDVSIPGFIWLNPDTEDVSVTPDRSLKFEVTSLLDSLKDQENRSFMLFPPEQIAKGVHFSLYREPLLYLLLLPGILFALLVKSGRVRRFSLMAVVLSSIILTGAAAPDSRVTGVLETASNHFARGEYGEALNLYNSLYPGEMKNAFFLYNRGVLQYLNHQKGESVSSLRSAVYLRPANSQISNTLQSIEETLGLEHQFSLSVLISPDILFVVLVVSVNLVFILLSLPSVRQKSASVIFVILLVFSGLLSGAELIRSSWILRRGEGIIRQDVSIRKIPDIEGSPWILLPEGTAVEIVKDYQGFVLIYTAYGLEGWVPSDDLIDMSRRLDDEI